MNRDPVIALATDSLLYAPLFIAQEAGLFGDLQVKFGLVAGDQTKGVAESKPTGSALPEPHLRFSRQIDVMYPMFDANGPLVVVCDPMHGFVINIGRTHKDPPVLMGALITAPACRLFDRVDSFVTLLKRVEEGGKLKILAHPRGWSADTLLRWALKHGSEGRIDHVKIAAMNLVEAVDPGFELKAFSEATLPQDLAAVTVDLLRIHELLSLTNGRLVECADFVEGIPPYLMTGLLSPTSQVSANGEIIEKIFSGMTVGLRILQQDPEYAFKALRQHYRKRELGCYRYDCGGYKHLTPLPVEPCTPQFEEALQQSVEELAEAKYYPARVTTGEDELRSSLNSTWDIYRDAHIDQLPHWTPHSTDRLQVLGTDKLTIGKLPRRRLPTMQLPNWMLSSLVSKNLTHLPKGECAIVVDWINLTSFQNQPLGPGHFKASWFKVVGSFMRATGEMRKADKEFFDKIRRSTQIPGPWESPLTAAFFGAVGTGKSFLAKSVLNELEHERLIKGRKTINCARIGSAANAMTEIEACLRLLEFSEENAKPTAIFLDELNKIAPSIYNPLLQYLKLDKDVLSEEMIRKLRRTIWFFAGTNEGTVNQVLDDIRATSLETTNWGGADFVSRLEMSANIYVFDPNLDPRDKLVAFIGQACTDGEGRAVVDRPKAIDPKLMAWCGTNDFSSLRKSERLMQDGRKTLSLRGGDVLTLDDVLQEDEVRKFEAVYDLHLKRLGKQPVTIDWDILLHTNS